MTIVSEFTSAAVSDRGLSESRPENEDSYLELPQYGLFAVADGVGGAQAGEVASQMAVEILGEAFINMSSNADPEDTMRIALERANEAIYAMSHDLPQLSSMATTVAAVHVAGDIATIAHVGDSRVYRVDGNGRLFRETDDHSVVEEEVRAGRMTAEQALNHPSRNVISRALGAEDTVEPDVKCVLVHPATTFLLCSDGITRHIDDSEIESLLSFGGDPAEICARMKEICFSRGAEDNLTAVVINFPGERQTLRPEDDDIEEVTIAGVRELAVEEADTLEEIEVPEEILTGESGQDGYADEAAESHDLVAEHESVSDQDDDNAYLLEDTDLIYSDEKPAPEADVASSDVESGAQYTPNVPAERTVSSYESDPEAQRNGSSGSLISTLGLLIGGILIGLVGGYFVVKALQPAPPPPIIAEQKSNNVPLTSFEERRRIVDADPVKYLNANAATPQEADDYFWLGRALLLTGKPVEAKRALEEARKRLPGFQEPSNIKTMENEIAMALVIADNPQASEAFARQIAPAAAEIGSNSNSSGDIIRQRR